MALDDPPAGSSRRAGRRLRLPARRCCWPRARLGLCSIRCRRPIVSRPYEAGRLRTASGRTTSPAMWAMAGVGGSPSALAGRRQSLGARRAHLRRARVAAAGDLSAAEPSGGWASECAGRDRRRAAASGAAGASVTAAASPRCAPSAWWTTPPAGLPHLMPFHADLERPHRGRRGAAFSLVSSAAPPASSSAVSWPIGSA